MSTLKVDTIVSDTTPTVNFTDGLNVTGVATATNFKTGSTNVHNTGVELANINTGAGAATFGGQINVGTAATIAANGNITAGIVTASSFVGDGSALTGLSGFSLSGSSDNTVVTVTGSNAMQGETNVRIDSSGRLLTGGQTTSVADASSLHADIQSHSADGNGLSLGRYANNAYDPYMTFFKSRNATIGSNGTIVQDGDTLGTINWYGATGSAWDHAAYHSVKVDGTPGASNDMPSMYTWHNQADGQQHPANTMNLRANGDLEVKTGNVVIGTAGKGIDFRSQTTSSASGVTVDSELLDHYEEGTWTPDFRGYHHSNGAWQSWTMTTAGTRVGRYIKIGRHVSAWCKFNGFQAATGLSYVSIIGLPFVPSPNYIGVAACGYADCFDQSQGFPAGGISTHPLIGILAVEPDVSTNMILNTSSNRTLYVGAHYQA